MNDATKAKIEALKANSAETNINFANEELGDEGAKLLAEAITGRALTSLNLYGCGISAESLKLFQPIITNSPNLISLNLGKLAFDFDLSRLSKLQMLELDECAVGNTAKFTHKLNNIISKNPALKTVSIARMGLILTDMEILFPILQKNSPLINSSGNGFNPEALTTALDEWIKTEKEKDFLKAISSNTRSTLVKLLEEDPNLIHTAKSPHGTAFLHALHCKADMLTIFTLLNYQPNIDGTAEFAEKHNHHFLSKILTQLELTTQLKNTVEQQNQEIHRLHLKIKQMNQSFQLKTMELESKIKTGEQFLMELESKIKTGEQFLDELLLNGAEKGSTNLIKTALDAGANMDSVNEKGENPLTLSLTGGHIEAATLLHRNNPQLMSKPNSAGQTAIEKVVVGNHSEATKWCLAKKVSDIHDFYITDEFNKLYMLASSENKVLLASNKLWESVKSGKLQGIQEILDTNVLNININTLYNEVDHETLLFKAVYYKHLDITAYLLSKGADVKVQNHTNHPVSTDINAEKKTPEQSLSETAYELAISYKDKNLVRIMTSYLLLDAIKRNDIKDITTALTDAKNILGENYIDILGMPNLKGETALHLTVIYKNEEIMPLLLNPLFNKSPILEIQDSQGKTALHYAIEQENEKICGMLLDKGANVAAKDNKNQIPLHIAAHAFTLDSKIHKNIIKKLVHYHVECKHNIEKFEDNEGKTLNELAEKKVLSYILIEFGKEKKAVKIKNSSISIAPEQTLFSSRENNSSYYTSDVETSISSVNELEGSNSLPRKQLNQ